VDRGVRVSRPLSYLRLPIPEGATSICDDRQLMGFVESLVSHIKADDGMYMHCDDGNGRTGTVASILLGVLYGLGSSEAMETVLRFRNQRSSGQKGDSPETHEQKMQVHRILQDRGWLQACRQVGVQSSADPNQQARGDAEKVQEKLRTILARRGAKGIIGLGRSFKIMDDDGSRSLGPQEFSKAMRDFGMGITEHEVAALFKIYDTDGSGGISFDEFLHGLRGPMSPLRLDLVYQAFAKMDRTNDGVITIEDIEGCYNAREHPDVKAGRKTEREIMGQVKRRE
jgi:Ca2+-binding EF-hand superfamily protein